MNINIYIGIWQGNNGIISVDLLLNKQTAIKWVEKAHQINSVFQKPQNIVGFHNVVFYEENSNGIIAVIEENLTAEFFDKKLRNDVAFELAGKVVALDSDTNRIGIKASTPIDGLRMGTDVNIDFMDDLDF